MELRTVLGAVLIATVFLCSACAADTKQTAGDGSSDEAANSRIDAPVSSQADSVQPSVYYLDPPAFLDQKDIALCPLAQEYLTLNEEAFAQRYPPQKLWDMGAFDRLLFSGRYEGPVVAGISVGDSIDRVLRELGEPQFPLVQENMFRELYGYKTPELYFAFQVSYQGEIKSICLRRRYPLPENKKDILPALAGASPWYGDGEASADYRRCFDEATPVSYAQWWRGSMSLICDYGFTSTSLDNDTYVVYADFEGEIPRLPPYKDPYSGEDIDPLSVLETDYPERLILNIYAYLSEVDTALRQRCGEYSPDGSVYAWAVTGNLLDMRQNELYECAHVTLHWMDGSRPDENIYFGHFSTVVGFINNRYLAESDLFGLHIYDLQRGETVYRQEEEYAGRTDLRIDRTHRQILDMENQVQFTYTFNQAGEILVSEAFGSGDGY